MPRRPLVGISHEVFRLGELCDKSKVLYQVGWARRMSGYIRSSESQSTLERLPQLQR
jgi:hypothetical protein